MFLLLFHFIADISYFLLGVVLDFLHQTGKKNENTVSFYLFSVRSYSKFNTFNLLFSFILFVVLIEIQCQLMTK